MKLHRVSITASPDDEPNTTHSYAWQDGESLDGLRVAIAKLVEYLALREDALKTALASQPPMEINPS